MGWYRTQVVPRLIDVCCGMAPVEIRARVCAGLAGDVVEVGFGSGLNVPHYPAGVRRVLAVEPSQVGFDKAGKRLAASPVAVERVGLDGQRLPLDDASMDAALSTWTLCTIPDPHAALVEIRRVLKPGGRFHFVEHGLAPDAGVARWQNRLNGLQNAVAGGCNINRPIERLLLDAGFRIERLDNGYEKGAPKPLGYLYEGLAAA
jgi:ubiquinone/menaquinone biosynthesis C-methylase UbiE